MEKQLKTLVELLFSCATQTDSLVELLERLRMPIEMLGEMVEYDLEHKASQKLYTEYSTRSSERGFTDHPRR